MVDPHSVRFSGPLARHVDGFWAALAAQQYSPFSGRNLLLVAAHFSRWLESRGIGLHELAEAQVAAFMAHRRQQGYTQYLTPRALAPLLGYLAGCGIAIRRAAVVETPIDRLLRDYAAYLAGERGLVAGTIRRHVDFGREFAVGRFDGRRGSWQITPAEITSFVVNGSRRWTVPQAKNQVEALRSLLRFLHVRGWISRELAGCVPAVAGWRLAWLPRGLEPTEIDRLFRQEERHSAIGRRDAAIVRLLLRLGMRAGEVAALELDDLDWRAGEIAIHGKGRRQSRLPLPHDVGRAIAAYLRRGRRSASTRRVFLRSRAPCRALTTGGVLGAVRKALRRAGIPSGGAHRLRHTAATMMLRRGATLSEIAHVLRHRHPDTTAIYAKVDYEALRTLAQPWPEGAP